MNTVTRVLIVAKNQHKEALNVAEHMRARLNALGVQADMASADDTAALEHFCRATRDGSGLVLVLGGDGTLVGVIRRMLSTECLACPVLGINYGRVGFLVEVPGDGWDELLAPLVRGQLPVRSRLALRWAHVRGNVSLSRGYAVNDIVVARRSSLARVCTLRVCIEGMDLGQVRADGMIVSTPAGTSGYAYSAGSSLVHPDVQVLSLAANSPFLSHFPNMVLPPDKGIDIAVEASAAEAYLTVDGQDGLNIEPGDIVCVRGVPNAFQMVVPDSAAYFRRLRECGFTLEPSRNNNIH